MILHLELTNLHTEIKFYIWNQLPEEVKIISNNRNPNHVHSLNQAIDLLEVLAYHGAMGLNELSTKLSIPKTTTYRILCTFEDRGYIKKTGDRKYTLSIKMLQLIRGLIKDNRLVDVSKSEMSELYQKFNETVNIGVLTGSEVMYVSVMESDQSLRASSEVGSTDPFYATSLGKVIAAHLKEKELEFLLETTTLKSLTPNTITDKDDLQKELRKIKENGYAVDNEEICLGIRCFAAPIFNMFDEVEGAISLSGASVRLTEDKVEEIIKDIRETARKISKKMGYDA